MNKWNKIWAQEVEGKLQCNERGKKRPALLYATKVQYQYKTVEASKR